MERPESAELKSFRKVLSENKFDTGHLVEYFCTENKLEGLKKTIQEKCKGKCFFFSRQKDNEIHLIAMVNINVTKETEEKTIEVLNQIKENVLKASSFNPTGLVFGSRLPKKTQK